MDLPALLCRAHGLTSCGICALGIAGSQINYKHTSKKKLVEKLAAFVGIFSRSSVNNDVLRAIKKKYNNLELDALLELQATAEQEREAEDEMDEEEGEEAEPFMTISSRVGKRKRSILNPTRRNETRCAMLALRDLKLVSTCCFFLSFPFVFPSTCYYLVFCTPR